MKDPVGGHVESIAEGYILKAAGRHILKAAGRHILGGVSPPYFNVSVANYIFIHVEGGVAPEIIYYIGGGVAPEIIVSVANYIFVGGRQPPIF